MANYKQSSRNITLLITNVRPEGKLMKFNFLSEYARDQLGKLERLFMEKEEELERMPGLVRNYQIPHGSHCCVKSRLKNQWCRACVLPVEVEDQKIGVLLVDYGNTEAVPLSNVRSAESIVPSFPPLTTEGILADVAPAHGEVWPEEATTFCQQHLLFQNLSGYIVTDYQGIPVVRVAKLGESEPFVQRLIDNSLAKIHEIEPPKTECFTGQGFKLLPLEFNTTHLVTVSCILTPQVFYVQLSAAEVELKNLMDSIERCASYEQLGAIPVPKTGLACLAQHNQHYYRAIIQDMKHGICKVSLVDYGNLLNKYIRELRSIPVHFLSLPAQAIRCSLRDAQMLKTEDFIAATKINRYLTCHVLGARGEAYVVNLLHNGENILKSLQQPAATSYCIQPLTIGTTLDVTSSYVSSPHEFYCQITSCKEDLDIITRKLKPAAAFEMVSIQDIVPGLVACAKFSEDSLWYRAKVLSVQGNFIEVFFVDFGNTDRVKSHDIRMMPNNLLAHPVHAYKFGLFGFSEANFSDDIIEWFETLVMENSLRAEIKSVTKDDFYYVVLHVEHEADSVNEMLRKKLSQPVSLFAQLSDPETLYVTSYHPPCQFFGQLTKFDQDTLNHLQEEINSYCSRSQAVTHVNVGDLVCAKFFEDNQFYRARVESLAPSGCNVFFVDYGNRSYVKMKDICEISSKYLSHPFFGVECVTDKSPAVGGDDALEVVLLDTEVQVRPIEELSSGKWRVSFVESFAGNFQILKLLSPRSIKGAVNSSDRNPVVQQNSNWTCNSDRISTPHTETFKHSVITDNSKSQADILNSNLEDYDEVLVPHGSFKEIFVSYVKSPSEFYCQMIHESSDLQQMMEKLNQMYSDFKSNDMRLEKIKVGAPCCAIYEEDSMWYRAKIVSVHSDKCEVFFVDYGNRQVSHIIKLKALHPDFFSTPTQALKCSLFNTVPQSGGWKASDTDAFMEMASEKSFVAQFVKTESNGTHLVNLFDINKLKDGVLSKDFVKLGHGQLEDSNKLLVVNSVVASTSLTFEEPDIHLGAKEEVIVTWVTNAVQFYCQIKSRFPSFKTMMEKIQSHYGKKSENEDSIDRPHTGMICVAQFTEDCAWYRAKIVDVEKNTVQVYYVDYGNEERIKKNNVKYILQDFTSLPVQAIKCHLQGLYESVKTLPDSLPSLFEGKSICTFISKHNDYFIVDLECDNRNVAEEIVALHLAASDKVISDENANLSTIPNNIHSFQKDQLVNVIVSHVESPGKFWCQLEDSTEQLQEIAASIETYCASSNTSTLQTPAVGVSCLAKYSENEGWYRATVKKLLDFGKMEVLFVDYGNTEVIHSTEAKSISPDFLSLPAQAIECQLHGLPQSYDAKVTDKFQQLVDNASELMAKIEKIHDGVLTVSLFDQSDEEEVNVFTSIFGVLPSVSDSVGEFFYQTPEIPAGEQLGYISSVSNPSELFIQLTSQEANLEQQATQISEKYQSSDQHIPLDAVKPGMACCAKYSKDGEWYRAQITNVEGDNIAVLFVDYGNSDIVTVDSLQYLDKCFFHIPPFAIPCQLANIQPVGDAWAKEAVDKLNDYMDEQLNITFIEQALPCPVYIQKNGRSLNNELVELNFAIAREEATHKNSSAESEVVRTAPQALIPASIETTQRVLTVSNLSAIIPFVESFENFFITAVDWNKELADIMQQLEDLYLDESQEYALQSTDIKVGMCCAARYSVDESWYRAAITEIDGNNVVVRFIDYGNMEKVAIEKLRCLKHELLKYPPYAVECHLDNIHPVEGKENEIKAILQDFSDEGQTLQFEVQLDQTPYKVQMTTPNGDFLSWLILEGYAKSSDFVSEFVNETYPHRTISANKLSVNVCFVDSWKEFYVTPFELSEELLTLMNMVKEQYEGKDLTSLSLSTVQKFQPCSAKYSADNMWYRAVVNDVDGDNIFVNFVDYGNSEVVAIDEIKKLTPELLHFPPFALKCHLYGFIPTAGAEDIIVSKLQTLADEEETLEMEIIENCGTSYLVKISNGGDFVQNLIKEGFGVEGNTSAEENAKTTTFSEEVEQNFEDTHEETIVIDIELPERKISCGKQEARISYVDTWDKFYITATEWEQELLSLKNDLTFHYANKNCDPYDEVYEGQIGIYINENQDCYRVIVQRIEGVDAWVQCVDYGKMLVIKSNALNQLSAEFLNIPPFSVECRLSELLPVQGAESDIADKLQTFAVEKTKIEVEVLNHDVPYDIRIKTDTDFVTQLVHDGLATAELPSPERLHARETFKDNLQIAFVDDLSDEMTKYQISPQSLTCDKIVGVLQHCEIRNGYPVLYVVPSDLLPTLEGLHSELQTIYDDTSAASMVINEGDYCVAKFPSDSSWYRAQVVQKTEDSLLVKSLDYGSAELVPIGDIRKLVVEFSETPQYSVECCMLGIRVNENCKESVVSKLLNFESDWTLHLCQISSHNEASCSCITKAEVSGFDVVEVLIKENLVKQVFPVVNDLKIFQCDVLAIDEDLTFHLLPHDWIERRNIVHESLNSTYRTCKQADLPEITTSRLYAALKDSVWYRSVIHSIVNTTAVVEFVDFGTTHHLDVSDLCILCPDFCHMSAFCIQGNLDGLPKIVNIDLQQKVLDIVSGKDITCVKSDFDHSMDLYLILLTVSGRNLIDILKEDSESLSEEPNNVECSGEIEMTCNYDEGLVHSVKNFSTLNVEEPVDDVLLDKQTVEESDQQLEFSDQLQEVPDFDQFVNDIEESEAYAEKQEIYEDELDRFGLVSCIPEMQNIEKFEAYPEQQEVSEKQNMKCFDANFKEVFEKQDAKGLEAGNLEQEVPQKQNVECFEICDKNQEISQDQIAKHFEARDVIQEVSESHLVEEEVPESKLVQEISASQLVEEEVSESQFVEEVSESQLAEEVVPESQFVEEVSESQLMEEEVFEGQHVEQEVFEGQHVEQEVFEGQLVEQAASAKQDMDRNKETDEIHEKLVHNCKGSEIKENISIVLETKASDDKETLQNLEIMVQGDFENKTNHSNLTNASFVPEELSSSPLEDSSDSCHLSENNYSDSYDIPNIGGCIQEEQVHGDLWRSLKEEEEEEEFCLSAEHNCDEPSLQLNEEAEKTISDEVKLPLETAQFTCSGENSNELCEDNSMFEVENHEYACTERELPVGKIDVSILDFKTENSSIFLSVIPVALMTELQELQSNLQSYTSEVGSGSSSGVEQGPCAILSDDNVWHRGEVLERISDTVIVSYWDMDLKYVTTDVEHVKKLDPKFCVQLPFVVTCTIPSVKCCDGDTVVRKLQEKLKGKVVSVETLSGSYPVPVKILDDDNIIQQLLSSDLLTLEIPSHTVYSGEHLANISYIDDLSGLNIYIQWVDQLENLAQLHAKMQLEYDKKENGVRLEDATSVGMYAVKNNGTWERCKVLTADDTVLFYFIDTGECKEAVDTVLQPLLFEFILDPPYAYQCHISNLPPISEDIISEVILALKEVSLDRKLFATILERNEDGFYSVYLTVDKEDVLQWLKKLEKLSDDLKMILEKSTVQSDRFVPETYT